MYVVLTDTGEHGRVSYREHQKSFDKYDDAMEYAISMINYSKKFILYNEIIVWIGDYTDIYPPNGQVILKWSKYDGFWMDEPLYLKHRGKVTGAAKLED